MRYSDSCGCSRASYLSNVMADTQERVICHPYGYICSLIWAIEAAKLLAGYTVSTPRYRMYQIFSPVPKELNPWGGVDRLHRVSRDLGGEGSNIITAALVFKYPIGNRSHRGHVHPPPQGLNFNHRCQSCPPEDVQSVILL